MEKLKLALFGFILTGLTACGGGGNDDSDPGQSGVSGLSECAAPNAEQAVVCGTILANDGVTPLVNAEITVVSSSGKLAARGVADDDKCLTDGAGDYVCLLPSSISGSVVLKASLNGFDDQTFTTTVTKGETTETNSQTLTGNTSEKWVVIPGIYDGVQVLLAQLKGCTLSDGNGNPYTSAIPPDDARGSTDCESKGLVVLDDAESITGYLSTNELLDSDSLFINCQADYSTPEVDSLVQSFVNQGGHVYFSDLSDSWLTKAFPDKITFSTSFTSTGTITASAITPGLASVIGNSVDIEFDLPAWTAIESVASDVTSFIEADISSVSDLNDVPRPITVGWKENSNSGCVFYTSYHIEGAETAGAPQELAIKYLVQNISSVCQ